MAIDKENIIQQILETSNELDLITDELEKLLVLKQKLQAKIDRTQKLLDPKTFNTKTKIKTELLKRIPSTVKKFDKIKVKIEAKKMRQGILSKNLIALQSVLKHLEDIGQYKYNYSYKKYQRR